MGAPVTFYKLLITVVNKMRAVKRGNGKYNIKDDPKQKKSVFHVEKFVYLVAITCENKSTLGSGLSKAEQRHQR